MEGVYPLYCRNKNGNRGSRSPIHDCRPKDIFRHWFAWTMNDSLTL